MCLIDVYDMAEARENRRKLQLEIIEEYHIPLISFTLNIPGPRKSSSLFSKIHNEGMLSIKRSFAEFIQMELTKSQKTGPEAYFAINLPVDRIKHLTIAIEEDHILGRIFDIDVIDTEGNSFSRNRLDFKPRKCLICEQDAAICSRNRTHSVDELISKIESISRLL